MRSLREAGGRDGNLRETRRRDSWFWRERGVHLFK